MWFPFPVVPGTTFLLNNPLITLTASLRRTSVRPCAKPTAVTGSFSGIDCLRGGVLAAVAVAVENVLLFIDVPLFICVKTGEPLPRLSVLSDNFRDPCVEPK